jgi:hypothetical protein
LHRAPLGKPFLDRLLDDFVGACPYLLENTLGLTSQLLRQLVRVALGGDQCLAHLRLELTIVRELLVGEL